MGRRLVLALSAVAVAISASVSTAWASWPTTCVELNDIVEAHLGNHQNVGIYQRVFGASAEQACRNDHGDEVRVLFAWAMEAPGEDSEPVVEAGPSIDRSLQSAWHILRHQLINVIGSDMLSHPQVQTVSIVVRDMPNDNFMAAYFRGSHEIVFDVSIMSERDEFLATLLVHELTHVIQSAATTVAECIYNEVDAWINDLAVWYSFNIAPISERERRVDEWVIEVREESRLGYDIRDLLFDVVSEHTGGDHCRATYLV